MKKTLTHLDGWLYVGIGVAGCVLNHLATPEAVQLFSPAYLFILKLYADALGVACLAAKTYRSTTFAQIVAETKTANPPTQTLPPAPPAPPAEPK